MWPELANNALFSRLNYQFSTTESGRLTTFYFQDASGNMGRIRRQHRDGPLAVYQGKCKRIFLSPDAMNDIDSLVDDVKELGGAIDNLSKGNAVFNGHASLTPQADWHVFDFFIDEEGDVVQQHGSGGAIILSDMEATEAAINELRGTIDSFNNWETGIKLTPDMHAAVVAAEAT